MGVHEMGFDCTATPVHVPRNKSRKWLEWKIVTVHGKMYFNAYPLHSQKLTGS